MTFKTGSITSATPAKALFDLLDPDLTGVGYVRVETGLASGGVTWNVYRSPAASNFFGQDWYFALGYDTSAQTTLYSCVFEDWDATNDLAIRFAPSTTGLAPGVNYENPQAPSALPAGFTLSHLLPTTAFTYAYSSLIDRVAVAAWTAATTSRFGWYIGLYDSFYSTADDPFPLILCTIGGSANTTVGASSMGSSPREPLTTSTNTLNFFVTQGNSGSQRGLTSWNTEVENLYQGIRPWVSRVIVGGRGGSYNSSAARLNYPRGLFRDLFITASNYSSNGDRMTWTTAGQSYGATIFRTTNGACPVGIAEY